MAEITLTAAPLLGGLDLTIGGTRLRERDDLALVSVAIPRGEEDAVEAGLEAFGLAMPASTRAALDGDRAAVSMTPDQVMVIFPHPTPDAVAVVRREVAAGYFTDQTDAWVVLELSGPLSQPALERLSMVDLSPEAFPVGASARTTFEHMGALVIRTETGVLLASASSSAKSFSHAIEISLRNVS